MPLLLLDSGDSCHTNTQIQTDRTHPKLGSNSSNHTLGVHKRARNCCVGSTLSDKCFYAHANHMCIQHFACVHTCCCCGSTPTGRNAYEHMTEKPAILCVRTHLLLLRLHSRSKTWAVSALLAYRPLPCQCWCWC